MDGWIDLPFARGCDARVSWNTSAASCSSSCGCGSSTKRTNKMNLPLHCRHGDADAFNFQKIYKWGLRLIHRDTYTGAKAVGQLRHHVEEVLHSSLLPWCRAVILLEQDDHLVQDLHRETKSVLRLRGDEEEVQEDESHCYRDSFKTRDVTEIQQI